MANFNVNQVRHLYVAKTAPQSITPATVESALDDPGDFGYSAVDADGNFYFASRGATGDLVRSDLINVKGIRSITYLAASDDVYSLKRKKIQMLSTTNSGNPVVGQNYTIVVTFNGILGFSAEDTYIKIGSAHATTGMTANQLLGELAVSLYQNIAAENVKLAEIYCGSTSTPLNASTVAAHVAGTTPITGSYILIEEVEQAYKRGVLSAVVVPFDVTGKYIDVNGDMVPWANISNDTTSLTTIKNSKKIADLEYFCMGERGDWYRKYGWPHVIDTEYLVNPLDTNGYDILTLHYQYIGNGDEYDANLSKKDIQIVAPAAVGLSSLKAVLDGYKNEAYYTAPAAEQEPTG